MKILLIGPAHPLRGGIAQFLALLQGALRKAGHTVVFHRFIRQYPKFLFPGKSQEDESDEPVKADSVPSLDPLNPFNWPFAAYRIAREKPDLVILKWWMPFFGPSYIVTLWLAKLLCNTKVMLIIDNAIPHEKRPGDMLITKLGFGVTDYFVVMSETVKRDLLTVKPDANVVLSPHPLYEVFGEPQDKDAAKKALGVSGPVLLFFGFVRAYKGLKVLLDAMPAVLKEMDATLVVAGEFYEDKESYLAKIDALGISKNVVVLDRFIANESVGEYFSAADLLVLPYLSATQSGITQIAFVFGLPVVATNVGGLPEVVKDGETGFLVPPEDPRALAEAILRFFKEGREADFKAGIAVEKRRFSWDGMVKAIEGFFDNP
ncbi:MAG: glycosyltransferase [Nitrospirae bacterium]|nr:glycosyltransferase [Nitrospirota bacterium]MBI5696357.1 glycosyltransferase [Nitrospirota bacterium]